MKLSLVLVMVLFGAIAQAGTVSLGVNFGIVTGNQTNMDDLIASANADSSLGPITTSTFGNAFEVTGILGYRFDGSAIAIHLQPSYYWNSEDGTGQTGAFNYELNGAVIMPMLRLYALENDFLSLFFQAGIGWGYLDGEINEGVDQTEFGGSNLGYQFGLGLNLCYEGTHCLNVESNVRFLDIERNITDSSTSSGTHASGRITQSTADRELEIDGEDFQTTMSGVQVLIGYVFKF